MTRLDIVQALMVGAGISHFQAAKALQEHDAEVRRAALANAHRHTVASMALAGVLAQRVGAAPPEELVHQALQHADIMLKELDK